MTQDDWFNIILPIICVVFLIGLCIEYYQDKRYHKNFEDEKLKLKQEKASLKKEIAEFRNQQ